MTFTSSTKSHSSHVLKKNDFLSLLCILFFSYTAHNPCPLKQSDNDDSDYPSPPSSSSSASSTDRPYYLQLNLVTPRASFSLHTSSKHSNTTINPVPSSNNIVEQAPPLATLLPECQDCASTEAGSVSYYICPTFICRFSRACNQQRLKMARFFCDHISAFIFLGLVSLFVFNLGLYSYIFFLAHRAGHDF